MRQTGWKPADQQAGHVWQKIEPIGTEIDCWEEKKKFEPPPLAGAAVDNLGGDQVSMKDQQVFSAKKSAPQVEKVSSFQDNLKFYKSC